MQDTQGSYTRTYDDRNMVTSVTNPDDQILTFTYDALGQRDYMVNVEDGSRTTYTYNALGQLDNLINGNDERTTFSESRSGCA